MTDILPERHFTTALKKEFDLRSVNEGFFFT